MAKESSQESIRPNRLHHSNDERLDEVIAELEGIDAGHHLDSGKFKKVMESIDHLHEISSPFYTSPVGGEDQLKAIKGAYTALLEACDAYLEGKGEKRRSEYGTQRLNCIRAIRDISMMDSALLDPKHPAYDPSKKLGDLLAEARSTTVSIAQGETIQPVGGGMSSRIPLEVEGSQGTQKGFFTADQKNLSESGLAKELVTRLRDNAVFAPLCDALEHGNEGKVLGAIASLKPAEEKPDEVTGGSRIRGFFDRFRKKSQNELSGVKDFCGGMNVACYDMGYRTPKELSDPESFRAWVDSDPSILPMLQALSREITVRKNTLQTNKNNGAIQPDTEIPSRNIGMSRFAEALGCGHLIAKAERMTVLNGGKIQTGVFMQTAEGSDFLRPYPSDPLVSLFYHQEAGLEAMESGGLKKSLANLQVLDYICGNVDRYQRNMIYQTGTDSEGRLRLEGVIGIDNDLSFGNIWEDTATLNEMELKLHQLRVIPRETAALIMQMDRPFVEHQLSDLGLHSDEIDAACKRIYALQRCLMDPERVFYYDSNTMPAFQLPYAQGKLLIVQDELDFQRIPYQEMIVPNNEFDRVSQLPAKVKKEAHEMYEKCRKDAAKKVEALTDPDTKEVYESEQKQRVTGKTVPEAVHETYQKMLDALDKVPPIHYAKAKIREAIAVHKNKTETHTSRKIDLQTLEEKTSSSERGRTKAEGAEMRRQRRMSEASEKRAVGPAMSTQKT